jgi:hypothetical protein
MIAKRDQLKRFLSEDDEVKADFSEDLKDEVNIDNAHALLSKIDEDLKPEIFVYNCHIVPR